MKIITLPLTAQLTDSDKKQQYHYEVEFIFGTHMVRIIDLKKNLYKDLRIDEPVTGETYREEFDHICAAMAETGLARENDKILCTTFPEGTRRVEGGKYLRGLFGQGGKRN
jgi:hypothetical protein